MPELLAHYPFTDTAYHELLDRQGGVRPPVSYTHLTLPTILRV